MKKHIPNLITTCNLLCGVVACVEAMSGRLDLAAAFILGGIFFDFFDGLSARLLHVASDIGKELDSLADVVTSGVAPGLIAWNILSAGGWMKYLALIIPACAAYRLAKFNLDTRQSHSFLGLPAPSNAVIWVGIALAVGGKGLSEVGLLPLQPLAAWLLQPAGLWTLVVVAFAGSILMISELPMFALKVKNLSWRDNSTRYIFLIVDLLLLLLFGVLGLCFIIIWYILLSVAVRKSSAQ